MIELANPIPEVRAEAPALCVTATWMGRPIGTVVIPTPIDPYPGELVAAICRHRFSALLGEAALGRTAGTDSECEIRGLPRIRAERPLAGHPSSDVSVVVCTRGRPALLDRCLASVASLRPQPGEVLVVDNAPVRPDAERIAARHGASYVIEPRPGLDHARNRGWRTVRTEVVAYLDDDAEADAAWAERMGAGFFAPSIGAVTGLVEPLAISTRAERVFETLEGGMSKGCEPRLWGGSADCGIRTYQIGVGTNLALRRRLLEALGGFDPRLDVGTRTRGGGDLDILYRALRSGHLALYKPDAIVRHQHRRTIGALLTQMYSYGVAYSAVLTVREDDHPRLEVRRERLRWHVDRHIVGPVRTLRRGHVLHACMLWVEALGSMRGRRALRSPQRPTGPDRGS